jgi:hypothetical protein
MAGPLVDEGAGATLLFSATSYTAEIVSMNPSGRSRVAIDTTHLASTANTHIRGDLIEPGELEVVMHYQPDNPPNISTTVTQDTYQITFPLWGTQTTGAKETFVGFVQNIDGPNIAVGEKMEVTVTIKMSGVITQADGA